MTATQSPLPGRTMRFTIPGVAVPKERVRHRIVQPKEKPPFVQLYTPAETRAYEERVAAIAHRAWGYAEPTKRPIDLQVTVYMPITEGWPRWKLEGVRHEVIVPTMKPDLDNLLKSISDAMNGKIYADDSQIVSVDAVKLFASPGTEPRIEVAVRENWRAGSWITRLADFVLMRR